MRRMTRRIGLFGGPAAMMSSAGVKKPSVEKAGATPAPEVEKAPDPAPPSATPPKKSWLRRLFGSD